MLIIFDLDDTLIETSQAITPFQLQRALTVLQLEGKEGEVFTLNRALGKARLAVGALADRYGKSSAEREAAEKILYAPLPPEFSIPFAPGALEILNYLKSKGAELALVTAGEPSYQRQKVEKAGLDRGFFSMIAVSGEGGKKPFYEAAIKQFLSRPAWVCGDRVEGDLRPAHALGLRTVHIRQGRGAFEPEEAWIDHSIETLYEWKGIV